MRFYHGAEGQDPCFVKYYCSIHARKFEEDMLLSLAVSLAAQTYILN